MNNRHESHQSENEMPWSHPSNPAALATGSLWGAEKGWKYQHMSLREVSGDSSARQIARFKD